MVRRPPPGHPPAPARGRCWRWRKTEPPSPSSPATARSAPATSTRWRSAPPCGPRSSGTAWRTARRSSSSPIERQKKLTPELRERILAAEDLDALEDLYLPYKQKRKSKAVLAREAGPRAPRGLDLELRARHGDAPAGPDARALGLHLPQPREGRAPTRSPRSRGARDILVERLAETAELRARVRAAVMEKGWLRSTKAAKAKPHSKYETYFAFQERLGSLREPQNSHRYLALRRGAAEGELRLALGGPPDDEKFEERLLEDFENAAVTVPDSPGAEVLKAAARTALKEHVWPSIENEAHRVAQGGGGRGGHPGVRRERPAAAPRRAFRPARGARGRSRGAHGQQAGRGGRDGGLREERRAPPADRRAEGAGARDARGRWRARRRRRRWRWATARAPGRPRSSPARPSRPRD